MNEQIDVSTVEQFRDWLTAQIDQWCDENGLTPYGEGGDLGDLHREWDDAETFAAVGVTAVPAYESQTLFLVGPKACWIAATGIELGIESETVLLDPLSNLRLDVPQSELNDYRDRLRRLADEITALLG